MHDEKTNIKETITSVVIAFILAFVFRGFVVEAFMIPTGSMAPTLLGAHMRFQGPETGYTWTVGPWTTMPDHQTATPLQGKPGQEIHVNDPMSRAELGGGGGYVNLPSYAGDRIFVLKYLYSVFDPQRFDVVVFKNPLNPSVNYIKRLIGLPNEQIALIDGDVFVRALTEQEAKQPYADQAGPVSTPDTWQKAGWKIARKPERVQRSVWQPVYSSEYTPRTAERGFHCPWVGKESGWEIAKRNSYLYTGATPATLEWDTANRPVMDLYPYNQIGRWPFFGNDLARALSEARGLPPFFTFPVSDVRISFGVRPESGGLTVSPRVVARGHEFRGRIEGEKAVVEYRPVDEKGAGAGSWIVLGEGEVRGGLKPGVVTNIELWHVDQSLQLWVGERLVARGEYEWTPEERVRFATGATMEQVNASWPNVSPLSQGRNYKSPQISVEFTGGAFELFRVALSRDLHYQAAIYGATNDFGHTHSKAGQPAMATHPQQTPTLGPDEFFTCGDNSPSSLDARLWDGPNPWVREINPKVGVVDRHLLIGKAFFVYFPALEWSHGVPAPDFGRMRWIW